MPIGELIYANAVDQRVFDAEGDGGQTGIYLSGLPGRALPFVLYRSWKIPTGTVAEEIRFLGPSGRLVWRWGPAVRRMAGSMDSTVERDVVEDALFDEQGIFLAQYIIDNTILSEIEVPVFVQAGAAKFAPEIEEGLKKSDTIWVGTEDRSDGTPAWTDNRVVPVWFVYNQGKIYLLSKKEPGPEEQHVPGIPGASEVVVITRRKLRDTSLERFHAAVRILEDGPEFEAAAKLLVDRRRSRVGSAEERLKAWRGSCVIAELTPVLTGT